MFDSINKVVDGLNDRNVWWKYIKNVHEECYDNVNEDCSMLAHKNLGLDYKQTMKCVESTFQLNNKIVGMKDTQNLNNKDLVVTLIDKENTYFDSYGP